MPSSSRPIRLGVIGLSVSGGWAKTLLASILDTNSPTASKYKITALATRSAESAAETAKKYSQELGYTVRAYHGPSAARDIAHDPEVDLIVVTVKVGEHKAAVFPAIEAGKDVFVEWPLGKGFEETQEIAEKAKLKGVRTIVGAQAVNTPIVKKIREVVQSGGIGKVVSTTLTASIPKGGAAFSTNVTERGIYLTEANSGGTLTEIMAGHMLTGLIHALGDISSLSSTLTTLYPNLAVVTPDYKPTGKTVVQHNHDQVAFSGLLASGATIAFHLRTGIDKSAPGSSKGFHWIIDGELGSIEVTGDSAFYTLSPPSQLLINGEPWALDSEFQYPQGPLQASWEEFAKGEEGTYSSFEYAVKVHRVVDAILKSARDGVKVSIN